jgi:CRP-like cAMP-binding protein
MSLCSVKKDTIIFQQGTYGNFFYILKKGSVELSINNNIVKSMVSGDSFGELALLHGAVRSGTVKAKEDCKMWCLERTKFRTLIEFLNKQNFEENKKFIQSVPILSKISTYSFRLYEE